MEETIRLIGQLKLSGFNLEGSVAFPILGDGVLLTIGLSGDLEIHDSQMETLDWFYQSIELLYPQIVYAIFDYYKSVLPNYHLNLGDHASELMPPISNSEEIWKYVTEPGVFIFLEDEGGNLLLEYESSFDVEHGFRVVFENRKLIGIGID